jgi:hypothetical protein
VGTDGDWAIFLGILLTAYLGWLAIVIARFSTLDMRPSQLLFNPRKAHAALKDLRRVKPMGFWLALLPTIALVAVTPKIITMLMHLDWVAPSIASLSVALLYICLGACAVVGWIRWAAIRGRIADLEPQSR